MTQAQTSQPEAKTESHLEVVSLPRLRAYELAAAELAGEMAVGIEIVGRPGESIMVDTTARERGFRPGNIRDKGDLADSSTPSTRKVEQIEVGKNERAVVITKPDKWPDPSYLGGFYETSNIVYSERKKQLNSIREQRRLRQAS